MGSLEDARERKQHSLRLIREMHEMHEGAEGRASIAERLKLAQESPGEAVDSEVANLRRKLKDTEEERDEVVAGVCV